MNGRNKMYAPDPTTDPTTPRMLRALHILNHAVAEERIAYMMCTIGRPTKQRLAKLDLATYNTPKDWDGPMRITEKGRIVLKLFGNPERAHEGP